MTGRPWDEIENTMTMPRLRALEAIWDTLPPPCVTGAVTAQAYGMKPGKKKAKKQRDKNKNVGAALELAKALDGRK